MNYATMETTARYVCLFTEVFEPIYGIEWMRCAHLKIRRLIPLAMHIHYLRVLDSSS